ncbi:hypothetical protein L2E82_19479 [Cichorium intybus]|uniref:Uncharacterized protein n=1 Tax=Cichorium intybus TaxID=13427 RepID=A0ACB9FC16_CICIN|nr:hypothetical protein L2E82_19479 [Cichorium intybus]
MKELDGKFYGGNVMMMVNRGRFCAIGGGYGISVSVEVAMVADSSDGGKKKGVIRMEVERGASLGWRLEVVEWFVTDLGVVYPRELISPHQKLITDDNISCVISTEILIIPENRK